MVGYEDTPVGTLRWPVTLVTRKQIPDPDSAGIVEFLADQQTVHADVQPVGAFACTAGIVYNTSARGGAAAAPLNGRTVGVYDFGGTVSVGSGGGTMTFTMPVAAAGTALIQLA